MIEGDIIVVFDTEYTAWKGSRERNWCYPGQYREIVQIGAVKLDVRRGLEEIDSFERIARPRFNPTLSEYFIELTGITQERLDREGADFAEVLRDFVEFAGPGTIIYSNGGDEKNLYENCGYYGVICPLGIDRFRNLSAFLSAEAHATCHVETGTLDAVFGIPSDLPAHDGLADARKLAGTIRHLRQHGRM